MDVRNAAHYDMRTRTASAARDGPYDLVLVEGATARSFCWTFL